MYAAADDALNGEFNGDLYVGTLENEGVGIAPYHDKADLVSDELAGEVDALRDDIISGAVSVSG